MGGGGSMLDGGGHLDVGGRRARARVYASCALALCGGLAGCVLGAQGALAVAFFSVLFSAMLAAVGFSVREWWRGRSGGEGATEAAGAAGEATPLLQSSAESNVKAPPRQASRLWHLDDVKVSLTSIVVMHHVGCAFAEGGFYVTVGNYETSLSKFSRATAALDQSYFMVRAHATPAHPRLAHACTPTKSRHGLRKAALRRCQCAVPHNARTRPCLSTC